MIILPQRKELNQSNSKRLLGLDRLRSIAIIIMVFANSAAYFLVGDIHPLFRVISSLAAPLFITIAGASLTFSSHEPLKKFLKRGLFLFISASMVDVLAWRIFPFVTFDVLYLIAFGTIILGLLRFGVWFDALACLIILLISFLLNNNDYRFEIPDFSLFKQIEEAYSGSNIRRALIDGWFPVFPWVGYMFLGRFLFRLTQILNIRMLTRLLFFSLMFIGIFMLTIYPANPIRENYIEVFYPIRPLFALVSFLSLFSLFINFLKAKDKKNKWLTALEMFGKNSLFIYILHCILISFFAEIWQNNGLSGYMIFCVAQLLSIWALIHFIKQPRLRKLINALPFSVKAIFGLK